MLSKSAAIRESTGPAGVPSFLDQLVEMLRSGGSTGAIDKTAGQHGHDLLRQGSPSPKSCTTMVTLNVNASTDRLLIEVHDECGGLPGESEGKDATNRPGSGCVFTVDLPRTSVPAPASV